MKKVILILIDSLMAKDLENAVTTSKAPALKFLMENGDYHSECVTSFPTMTASVDASLVTGLYPDQHKVPGLIWYNPDEKRLIDYINGTKTVLKLGVKTCAQDVLVHLNEKHLSKKTKTIFEELEDRGKTSGTVNFIMHRGKKEYFLKMPFFLNLMTKFSLNHSKISGPEVFTMGNLHRPKLGRRKIPWSIHQTLPRWSGINDAYALLVTKHIIASGNQPDFMLIYFPDHDHFLHKHIDQPLKSLKKVDKKLADLLDSYGSWENALKHNVFIIIGDHGQTKIGNGKEFNIDLDKLLGEFKITPIGKKTTENDELIIANNERMVYIYPLSQEKKQRMIDILLTDSRIDFVAWKEKDEIVVQNHQGKKLSFSKHGEYIDTYGIKWNVDGDLGILDINFVKDKNIYFDEYPDVLSRLYGALYSQEIDSIVLSAKPSFEFYTNTFPTHLNGGSHGSIHKIDSLVPLIISGATKQPQKNIRLIGLKNYILDLLNVNSASIG